CFFFFQAEDGIRDFHVTGVQTCALPIYVGIGFASKIFSAFSRKFSIHSGSFLCAEICRTISSSRPGRALKTGLSSVTKPYLYSSRPRPAIVSFSGISTPGCERGWTDPKPAPAIPESRYGDRKSVV